MREWVSRVDDTHYVIGSTIVPIPMMVRDFQAVISRSSVSRSSIKKVNYRQRSWPVLAVAAMPWVCFIISSTIRMSASSAAAAGKGIDTKLHAATIAKGEVGIFMA